MELFDDAGILDETMAARVTWIGEDAQLPLSRSVWAWVEQLVKRKSGGDFRLIEGAAGRAAA